MVARVKAPVWAGAGVDGWVEVLGIFLFADKVIDMFAGVVIGVDVNILVNVESIVVAVVSIVLQFVVSALYSVDALSDVVVDVCIEPLSAVRADVIIGFVVPDIGVDVLVGANDNVCVKPTPVEAFGC